MCRDDALWVLAGKQTLLSGFQNRLGALFAESLKYGSYDVLVHILEPPIFGSPSTVDNFKDPEGELRSENVAHPLAGSKEV